MNVRHGLLTLLLLIGGMVEPSRVQGVPWTPPVPVGKQFDWVRLVSGEWLGGTIESLREEVLEFDSDKLDLLKIDWEDVVELHSFRHLEYVFDDGRRAAGPAVMASGVVRIRRDSTEVAFPAAELTSIVEGAANEWDRWSVKASIGIVVLSGNTNQRDYNTSFFLRRETGKTRLDMKGSGNHGTLSGVKSVNNRQASWNLDIFINQRLYLTPLSVDLYTDEFQNTDLRISVSSGLGYDVVHHAKLEWSLGLSAGYLRTQYLSVLAGESDLQEGGAVIPSSTLEWDPTGDIEYDLSYTVTISTADINDSYRNLVGRLEVEVTDVFDLTFSTTWDHVETPKPAEDGTLPERDDVRFSFGLGVDL